MAAGCHVLFLKRASPASPKNTGQRKKSPQSWTSSHPSPLTIPSRTFQAPGPMSDRPAPHSDGVHHRREFSAKSKEIKPLLTREPLPHANDREKKQPAHPPKKRKRALPTTPPWTFPPKSSPMPSGRQDPPVSPPVFTRPSASESSTSSFDDPPPALLSDHEIHDQVYDEYDAHKRLRIFGQCPSTEYLTPSNPATPSTDPNESSLVPPEFYDSPASYTSSSSPAPSDRSPCAPEFAVQVIDWQVQGSLPMYPYSSPYVQQPAVHQGLYGYAVDPCPDRPGQGYPVQSFDTSYGRGGPHGVPTHPDNNGYPYPPHRY